MHHSLKKQTTGMTSLWKKLPQCSVSCLRQINATNTPQDLLQTLWLVLADVEQYCNAETLSRCLISRQNTRIVLCINDISLILDYSNL